VEGEKAVFTTVVPFTQDDTPTTYLANVKQTIEEITSYYQKKQIIKEEKVDIVLTGEVASDQWVKSLPPPAKILSTPIRNPAFNKAYATALPQMLSISEELTINLLPTAMQQFYDKERDIQYYKTMLFRACSMIGAYSVLVGFVLMFVIMQRQQLDGQVKQLTNLNQAQEGTSHNLLTVNGTAKQIIELAPLRKTPRDKLETFLTLVPSAITISNWEYDDSKVLFTVSGIAATREDLLEFKDTLSANQTFTNVSLPLTFLEAATDVQFTITFIAK
jgi:hypothetical protein